MYFQWCKRPKVTIKTRDKSSGNTASVDFDVIPLPKPTVIFGSGSANLSKPKITGGNLKAEYDDDRLNNSLKPRVVSFKVKSWRKVYWFFKFETYIKNEGCNKAG